MIFAGPEGLRKNQYRKFNIKSADVTPGDDFGMMREVVTRRFKRLLNEKTRDDGVASGGSPAPLAGEGLGEGVSPQALSKRPCPLPTPPPQAGQGTGCEEG